MDEATTIAVEIYAPESRSLELEVNDLVLPGEAGVFTVQPGHTPLLSALRPGVVVLDVVGTGQQFLAVSGGFAEVRDDRVLILASTYERSEDVDLERAKAAQQRAEERLAKITEEIDVGRAQCSMARALARIEAHDHTEY